MPFKTRMGVASFDDVLVSARMSLHQAESLLVSWDKRHMSAALMGARDEHGRLMDVSPDVLQRFTSLFTRPMPPDVVRMAFPEADVMRSGMLTLTVPVDEPVWARVLTTVGLRVESGLRVSGDDIRDAIWVTLEAAALPNGSVLMDRVAMFAETPDDLLFVPEALFELERQRGARVSWREGVLSFPSPEITRQLTVLFNELAVREEREQMLVPGNERLLLTKVAVDLG